MEAVKGLGRDTPALRFLVVIATLLSLPAEGDSCAGALPQSVNGCSVPFHLPFFYKQRFTPACNRHDICYGCGSVYGLNRTDCDSAFLQDMIFACAHPAHARGRRHVGLPRRHSDLLSLPGPPFRAHDARRGRKTKTLTHAEEDLLGTGSFILAPEKKTAASWKNAPRREKNRHRQRDSNSSGPTKPDPPRWQSRKRGGGGGFPGQKDSLQRLEDFIKRSSPSFYRTGVGEFEPTETHHEKLADRNGTPWRRRGGKQQQQQQRHYDSGVSQAPRVHRSRRERLKRALSWCRTFASLFYYPAVQAFGAEYFSKQRRVASYCVQDWVAPCLPLATVPSAPTPPPPPRPYSS